MVLPWMHLPRYNTPPALHSEQVRLSHQCSRNQENTGQRARCCWILNNRNWQEEKRILLQRRGFCLFVCLFYMVVINVWIGWYPMRILPRWTADTLLRTAEASAVAKGAKRAWQGGGRSQRAVTSCRTQTPCRPVCGSLNIVTVQTCKEKPKSIVVK